MATIEDLILLPKPRSVVARTGAYRLTGGSKIICQGDPGSLFPIAHRLQRALWENQRIGWTLRAGDPGIYGTRGGTTMTLAPEGGIPEKVEQIRVEIEDDGHAGGDLILAESFVDLIKGRASPYASLRDGLLSAAMCLAARESARTKTFQPV